MGTIVSHLIGSAFLNVLARLPWATQCAQDSGLVRGMFKAQSLQPIIGFLRSIDFTTPVMYGNQHGDLRRLTPWGCGRVLARPHPCGDRRAVATRSVTRRRLVESLLFDIRRHPRRVSGLPGDCVLARRLARFVAEYAK
jgi:hypothetical protein